MQYTLHRCLLLVNTYRVDNMSFHRSHNLKMLDCVLNPTTDDRNRPIIYFLLGQTEKCHKQRNNKQTNQIVPKLEKKSSTPQEVQTGQQIESGLETKQQTRQHKRRKFDSFRNSEAQVGRRGGFKSRAELIRHRWNTWSLSV